MRDVRSGITPPAFLNTPPARNGGVIMPNFFRPTLLSLISTLDSTSAACWFFFLMCGLFVLLCSLGLIFCPYVLMSFVRSLILCFCCDCPSLLQLFRPCSLFTCCAYMDQSNGRLTSSSSIHHSSHSHPMVDRLPSFSHPLSYFYTPYSCGRKKQEFCLFFTLYLKR